MQLTPLPGIPLIQPGDDLAAVILQALSRADIQLTSGDILVIAQKIVSKAEGRLVNLSSVTPSPRACELAVQAAKDPRIVELILQESQEVLRVRPGTIIVEHRLGFVCASAGIDHSNVEGVRRDDLDHPLGQGMAVKAPTTYPPQDKAAEADPAHPAQDITVEMVTPDHSAENDDWMLLLPENPDASAARIRQQLETVSGARLGVLIIDSHGRAWRLGVVGAAIGFSGLPGLVDMRGKPDLFGYRLRITLIAVADELAAAASLMMGQAAEGTPVVHVRGFPYPLSEGSLQELLRPRNQDLFR
jgi:coenzyme F420-0:L-glutamate ligase/coenzyme F420-1:gamma-L-glutamate ligase